MAPAESCHVTPHFFFQIIKNMLMKINVKFHYIWTRIKGLKGIKNYAWQGKFRNLRFSNVLKLSTKRRKPHGIRDFQQISLKLSRVYNFVRQEGY